MGERATDLVIHFDGACEPTNPGGVATCGWVIHDGEAVISSGCCEVRRGPGATNNVAEYCALGFALKWLVDNHRSIHRLKCLGDSQLVVRQINGEWKCNAEHLRKLRDRCRELLEFVAPNNWAWIPREMNEVADSLSRQAYEQATGQKFPERVRA